MYKANSLWIDSKQDRQYR